MNCIWLSSPSSGLTPLLSIIVGVILLIFSPFIPGLIGIVLAAIILILSLVLIGLGITMKGTGLSLPLIIMGLIGGVLSFYALVSPDVTASFIGILLGIAILLIGVSQLFFSPGFIHDRVTWLFLIGGGIVTILAGFYLILFPREGMQLVILFLGCYLIVYGLISLIKRRNTFFQGDFSS